MEQKKRISLDEVTLMRTILAILIVFMHSFTCYQGGWPAPEGFKDIVLYKWLARSSFAFTLEAFVFISGYLYAFQTITLKKNIGFGSLLVSKLKRLILPGIIFSAAYFAIFDQYKGIGNLIYEVIAGCGHMWFLPMLFWCFIGGWLLEKIKVSDWLKLGFLVALNLLSLVSLPFRLPEAAKFMFYFYAGFVFYKNVDRIKRLLTTKRLVIMWLFFVIVFIVLRPMKELCVYGENASFYYKLLMLIGNKATQLGYASIGTFVFFCSTLSYIGKHELRPFTIKLASCCFGIYLFQQFILWFMYYYTSIPTIVGPYCLPWIGFIITAPLSYFLSYLLLKTKIGKTLIG